MTLVPTRCACQNALQVNVCESLPQKFKGLVQDNALVQETLKSQFKNTLIWTSLFHSTIPLRPTV